MLYSPTLISIIEVLLVTLPALLAVAYVTVAERKILASMQRRLGPNIIGYYGFLQAFADALKLLLKEYISPTQANIILFFLGPFITLVFSLLGYAVIPYGPGLAITDFNLGILYILAVSSLSTYGILLAGWSANSKYAFLGSLRSTAQLISYELILSSAILLVVLLTGSLNLTVNIEAQRAVWFIAPLLPIFIVFFIGSIAETNRAPFDLAEAESELVSGFMTEHAAVIFVFFFLAEYASIALICILVSTLFLGGYLLDITFISYVISSLFDFGFGYCMDFLFFIITLIEIDFNFLFFIITLIEIDFNTMSFSDLINAKITTIFPYSNSLSTPFIFHQYTGIDASFLPDLYSQNSTFVTKSESTLFDYLTKGLYYGLVLALKSFFMIFVFIWARACFPRIRFDQLMSFCWTILLPILIGFILLVPCFIYSFDSIASNFCLLASFFISSNNKKVCFASKTLTLKAKRFFFITKNLLGDDKPGMSAARLEEIVTQAQFDLYMSGLQQGKISAETIAKSAGLSLKDIEAEVAEEEKERKRVKNKKKNEGRKKKKAAMKEENFNEENVNEENVTEKNVSEEKGKGKEENNSEKKDKGKGKEENVKKLTKVNYSSLNLRKPIFALALKGASIGFACILIATLLPVAIEFILLVPCLFTPLMV